MSQIRIDIQKKSGILLDLYANYLHTTTKENTIALPIYIESKLDCSVRALV